MGWKHFTLDEMKCSHTGECHMDEKFMEMLDDLREDFGRPMIISSAYRHPTHPVEAKKSRPGAHATGMACDVLVSGRDAFDLVEFAIMNGFTGIGVSQKGDHGSRFIHLDIIEEEGFPRPWIWSY